MAGGLPRPPEMEVWEQMRPVGLEILPVVTQGTTEQPKAAQPRQKKS